MFFGFIALSMAVVDYRITGNVRNTANTLGLTVNIDGNVKLHSV